MVLVRPSTQSRVCATISHFCVERYGAGSGSGGSAGCCGSCCKASFDEDAFDAEVKKDMEKTRDPNAQPVLKAPMAVEKAPSEEGEGKTAASTTAVTATGTS